jgi:hypothetical protein
MYNCANHNYKYYQRVNLHTILKLASEATNLSDLQPKFTKILTVLVEKLNFIRSLDTKNEADLKILRILKDERNLAKQIRDINNIAIDNNVQLARYHLNEKEEEIRNFFKESSKKAHEPINRSKERGEVKKIIEELRVMRDRKDQDKKIQGKWLSEVSRNDDYKKYRWGEKSAYEEYTWFSAKTSLNELLSFELTREEDQVKIIGYEINDAMNLIFDVIFESLKNN